MLHRFTPTQYHTTIGTHPPVLRLAPGDQVETTLVDSAGADASGRPVTPRGNPQTGPFHVEGAEPGDTLVVHLDRIRPNRPRGHSAGVLAAGVVDPERVRTLPERRRVEWAVDVAADRATPLDLGLDHLRLPLDPMIGCFGVAPAGGEAISTATSGPHGGNMDYRGFRAGTTALFPVFVPGALLHIGDGHALQGDGEIVGTGIEISMDVAFTVGLRKGRPIRWPRGEDATHLFTVGNARPLDQALQHATTEMLRLLEDDFALNRHVAQTLLGQCVEYHIGNVFDPAYTVVCRLSRALLAQVAPPS